MRHSLLLCKLIIRSPFLWKSATIGMFFAIISTRSIGATMNLKTSNTINELGWKLVQASPEGNAVSSPLSVWLALAMINSGARGETAKEISNVLGFSSNPDMISKEAVELQKNLTQLSQNEIKVSIANRVFPQLGDKLQADFLNLLAKNYHSIPESLNFREDPESSRKRINTWISENTEGKIPQLLARGDITDDIRIVLANAIYFKARWENAFPKSMTAEDKFYLDQKTSAKVQFMQQTNKFHVGKVGSGKSAALVCELPYENNNVSMVLVIPENIVGVDDVLNNFLVSPSILTIEVKSHLTLQDVELHIPKWTTKGRLSLSSFLTKLGMIKAFDPGQADFSGINGRKDLYLSEVIHGGFIEVLEEGTEAAAATANTVLAGAAPPQAKAHRIVKADRPFVWAIVEKSSGITLFSGRVSDPRI